MEVLAINLSWAYMGHHGLFLTTDYNASFLSTPVACAGLLTGRRGI